MKNFLKFIISYLGVVILAVLTSNIGKGIYGIFYPSQVGGDLGDIIEPGIIEGFVFVYLFFLALIFIPVFKNKWWKYALAPGLIVFVPFMLVWQIALFGLIFFGVGTALGYFALWIKKKM